MEETQDIYLSSKLNIYFFLAR